MLNICALRDNICRAIQNLTNNSAFHRPNDAKKAWDFTPKPSETRREHRALKTKLDKQNALTATFHFTFLFPIRKLRLVEKKVGPIVFIKLIPFITSVC